jgi:capsid protein
MLDSSKVGGAGVRGFAADVNKSIATRCEVLHMAMQRAALYIIAKRAKQGVYTLPEDWYRVTFTKPAQFTVDEGRMRKADIEDLRAGLITEDAIVEARGMNYSDILHKLAANAKMRQEIAAEYGIDESQLGILTKPGDIPVQVESEDDDDEEENQPNTNNENRNQ